jgi:hypothetical protein
MTPAGFYSSGCFVFTEKKCNHGNTLPTQARDARQFSPPFPGLTFKSVTTVTLSFSPQCPSLPAAPVFFAPPKHNCSPGPHAIRRDYHRAAVTLFAAPGSENSFKKKPF